MQSSDVIKVQINIMAYKKPKAPKSSPGVIMVYTGTKAGPSHAEVFKSHALALKITGLQISPVCVT